MDACAQVGGFPIYSRSGEVMVEAVEAKRDIVMPEEKYVMIVNFHKFVFSSVLRLEKDPMQFDPKKVSLFGHEGLVIACMDGGMTALRVLLWDSRREEKEKKKGRQKKPGKTVPCFVLLGS